MKTKNAVITKATISIEEHGCLTAWLELDYGGSGQGFGGFVLYVPKDCTHHTLLSPAGHFLHRVLEVAGVNDWSDLPGRTIRVRADDTRVDAIGHIVREDWFCPREDFAKVTHAVS